MTQLVAVWSQSTGVVLGVFRRSPQAVVGRRDPAVNSFVLAAKGRTCHCPSAARRVSVGIRVFSSGDSRARLVVSLTHEPPDCET